jgi:hypothetical protein
VKEHEGTKTFRDSAAASEAASYPLAASNGLAALAEGGEAPEAWQLCCHALPPAVSPSPPGFHRCLQGSTISSLSPHLPLLRPILILLSSRGSVKVHESSKASKDSAAASLRSPRLPKSSSDLPLSSQPIQGSKLPPRCLPISPFEAPSPLFRSNTTLYKLKRECFAAKAALRRWLINRAGRAGAHLQRSEGAQPCCRAYRGAKRPPTQDTTS